MSQHDSKFLVNRINVRYKSNRPLKIKFSKFFHGLTTFIIRYIFLSSYKNAPI